MGLNGLHSSETHKLYLYIKEGLHNDKIPDVGLIVSICLLTCGNFEPNT